MAEGNKRGSPSGASTSTTANGSAIHTRGRDEDEESLQYMRERDSDYLINDGDDDEDSVPIENLYSSAGKGDLDREGDAPESIRDKPIPLDSYSDESLRAAVENGLTDEVGDELGIEVLVEDGFVVLRGEVDSPDVRAYAEDTVRSIPGVRDVANAIELVAPAARSGTQITNER